jgi:two-component system, cell cycle sensor histidine kinase and response regulator CckA
MAEEQGNSGGSPLAGSVAEDVLSRSPELAAAVFRTSPAATILSRYADGCCLDANEAYCRLTGWSREELVGRTTTEREVWLSVEERQRLVSTLLARGRMAGVEIRLRRKNGELIETVAAGEVFSIGGERYILSFFFDITARKRTEEEKIALVARLQQAQKMESVGRLAGGVAHDFNNMLQVILANTELVLREGVRTLSVHQRLLEVQDAAGHAADLTRQMLAFARRQPIAPRILYPNQVIENLIKMLTRVIGEDIELVWRPGQKVWNVRVDPAQLDQILANIFINARDAIAGAGTIVLETANVPTDAKDRPPDLPPGDHVVVSVTDTGAGMSEEVLAHVFEPFYTTKALGKGTGLGLATVYGIVTQNRGYVTAASERGRGTTFRVYLPRCEEDPSRESMPSLRPSAAGGGETVLVAEDEPRILDLVSDVLSECGYHVLAARGAEEALKKAEAYDGPIALLITDVIMPGMDGEQLRARLTEVRPQVRCLFMSGYADSVIADRGILKDGVHFIEKPFALDAFVDKARRVIEGTEGAAAPRD